MPPPRPTKMGRIMHRRAQSRVLQHYTVASGKQYGGCFISLTDHTCLYLSSSYGKPNVMFSWMVRFCAMR